MDKEQRLTDLEVKVAFLERSHEELSEVVRELYSKVALLTSELQRARDAATQPAEPKLTLEDEKPPHY